MALIIKEIKLEVSKPNLIQAIVAKQNDCNSRFLKASLWDEGVQLPINPLSEVTINANRNDGASDSFFGEVNDDNTVTVPLHSWMLELDGTVNCDVSILVDGRRLTTTSFVVMVEKASNNSDNISTDPQYNVLADLIQQVEGLSGNNFANAIKEQAVGNPIRLDDVSPLEHEMAVSVKSKNLLPVVPYESSKTTNGITFTLNDDNSLTIKGTSTATASFYYVHDNSKMRIEKGVYTVSGANGMNASFGKMVAWFGKEYNLYDGTKQTISVEEALNYTLRITIYSGQTVDTTVYPMLELGNTASPYSKPVDVHGAFVKKSGKNIFNPSLLIKECGWTLDENGILSGPAYATHNKYSTTLEPYMTFENIERLTLSLYGKFQEGNTPSGLNFVIKYDDDTTQTAIKIMSSEYDYYEFTTPEGKKPVALHLTWGNFNGKHWLHDLQIEANSFATAYEPYHCETYPADANGVVNGVIGNGEYVTLMGDGVIISAEYNVDTKKYIDKKFAELAAMLVNE